MQVARIGFPQSNQKIAAELEAIHQTASGRRSAKSEMAFDIYKQCWAILSAWLVP